MTTQPLSVTEAATLARFEAAPPAPESFDATAALRRVLALADDLHQAWLICASDEGSVIAEKIRAAVAGPSC